MMQNDPKQCGSCYVCCTGILTHNVYGFEVGGEVDCKHISLNKNLRCSLYSGRPAHCCSFACAWLSQHSWPEWMRPDESGILAIIKKDKPLNVIETNFATEQAREFVRSYTAEREIATQRVISFYPVKYNQQTTDV